MIVRRFFSLALSMNRHTSLLHHPLTYPKSQETDHGIKFDQREIKRKMLQIKQRKDRPSKKSQQKLNFMNIDSNSQLARKIKKYRQSTDTQNLLHFTDVTVEEKPTTLQITGFDEDSIQVDNMTYPHSLIVFPTQTLIWQVLTPQNISIDDFIILKYINPKPTYVIVGMTNPEKLPSDVGQYLRSHYENFDCLQMFQASSQFNTTANDDISVVAFLISK